MNPSDRVQNTLGALKARNVRQRQSLVPEYLIFLLIGDICADHAHKPCVLSLHISLYKFYYKHSNQVNINNNINTFIKVIEFNLNNTQFCLSILCSVQIRNKIFSHGSLAFQQLILVSLGHNYTIYLAYILPSSARLQLQLITQKCIG